MSARTTEDAVGFFWKNLSNDLVPIDPDNISNKDWVILLEAGTIIGPSPQRIRVARWMQEKKIVKKHDMFLRTSFFELERRLDARAQDRDEAKRGSEMIPQSELLARIDRLERRR